MVDHRPQAVAPLSQDAPPGIERLVLQRVVARRPRGRWRMEAIRAAASRNETASITVTASRPPTATMMPPMAGPISRARWLFMPFSALAVTRSSSGFSRRFGSSALGRREQQLQAAADEEDDVGDPDAQRVDRQQRQQDDRHDQVDDHHQALAVPSVHEDPGHRAEQDRRDQEGEHHRAGGEGRAGPAVDLERQARSGSSRPSSRSARRTTAWRSSAGGGSQHWPDYHGSADGRPAAGLRARPVVVERDVEPILEMCRAAAIAEYGSPDIDERMIRGAYQLPGLTTSATRCWCWTRRPGGRDGRLLRRRHAAHRALLLLPRAARPRGRPCPRRAAALGRRARAGNVHLAPDGTRVACTPTRRR